MAVVHGLGERLRRAIGAGTRRDSSPKEDRGGSCAVIAVAAQKGGVGKTTTAVHLAAALASEHGVRVLLIDLDNQGHVASSLRAHVQQKASETISRVLLGSGADLSACVVPTNIDKLDVTASDKSLSETEALLATKIGRELVLRRALGPVRRHYDVVVFDCPPNLGLLTLNALMAADYLLIPSDLSILSLEGVDDLIQTVASLEGTFGSVPELLGMVYTRVDRRNRRHNASVRAAVSERYGDLVLRSEVGVNTAVSRAQLLGETVFSAFPEASGARDYIALAAEVHEHIFESASTQTVSLAS